MRRSPKRTSSQYSSRNPRSFRVAARSCPSPRSSASCSPPRLTVLGVGAADNAVANFDASTWMWSSQRSEVDRVNGVTARVDTRTRIKDAQNHEIHISQTDKYLVLRDLTTGQVSALDLTTLQISAVMPTTPGLGVSVALHGEAAFVIDSVQGQVRQLDPRSLAPVR